MKNIFLKTTLQNYNILRDPPSVFKPSSNFTTTENNIVKALAEVTNLLPDENGSFSEEEKVKEFQDFSF